MAEDAAAVAAKQRRQRITRRALIGFAVLVLIGGVVAYWRFRQVRQAKLETLEAIVQSETLALRLNDQSKFMLIQGPADEWRAVQRRNFVAFQNAEPRVTVTDEIIEMTIHNDEARVAVRVMVGEIEQKAVWLYAYTSERGWRHVGTIEEPWATHVLVGAGYSIEYHAEDEALAQDLASLIKSWWSGGSAVTGVDEPIHIDFVLDQHAADFQWTDDTSTVLIVPSRTAAGDAKMRLGGAEFGQLAALLADRWTADLLHGVDPDIIDTWVSMETRELMRNLFDSAQPRAEFYVRLTKAFGPDVLPEFYAQLHNEPESSQQAMIRAMAETAPHNMRPDDQLPEYLSSYLKAEVSFFDLWETQAYPIPNGELTRQIFMETYRTEVPEPLHLESEVIDPESIQVLSVEQIGDVLWARTTLSTKPRGNGMVSPDPQSVIRYIPFRLIDGYWRHTTARASDWGEFDLSVESEHVSVNFSALDASYAYIDNQLASRLEEVYQQAVSDFAITEPPYLLLYIAPQPDQGLPIMGGESPTVMVSVWSLHTYPWLTEITDLSNFYYEQSGQTIIHQLFSYVGEMAPGVQPTNFLPQALEYVEMRRLGLNPYPLPNAPEGIAVELPQTLDDIWAADPQSSSINELYSDGAAFICSVTLIDLLIERYGIDALPSMTRMLSGIVPGQPPQATIDDWLKFSLNITSEDIEREWRVRSTEALVQYGYLPHD